MKKMFRSKWEIFTVAPLNSELYKKDHSQDKSQLAFQPLLDSTICITLRPRDTLTPL